MIGTTTHYLGHSLRISRLPTAPSLFADTAGIAMMALAGAKARGKTNGLEKAMRYM